MTAMYDEAGPSALVMAAGLTVDGHRGDRTCPQCSEDGCRQLAWAEETLAGYRRERQTPVALASTALRRSW